MLESVLGGRQGDLVMKGEETEDAHGTTEGKVPNSNST